MTRSLSPSPFPYALFSVHPQLEDSWLDDEHSEFLEQLKMEMLEEQQREEMELAALQEAQEYEQVRKRKHMPGATEVASQGQS